MTLSQKQLDHPRFDAMSDTANNALISAAKAHGFTTDDLSTLEVHAGRVVDEIIALLLRLERMKRG